MLSKQQTLVILWADRIFLEFKVYPVCSHDVKRAYEALLAEGFIPAFEILSVVGCRAVGQ